MSETTTAAVQPEVPPTPPAAPPAPKPKSALALTAMILGIVAIVSAIIPGLSFVAFIPAIAAGVTGLIALLRKTPRTGQALTGLVLGPIALIVAIVVSITAIAGLANSTSSALDKAQETSESTVDESATEPAEEEAEPVAEIPNEIVYSGTGTTVIPIELVDGANQPAVAFITHSGQNYFSVWSLNSDLEEQDLLANDIGDFSGTVLFNHTFGSNDAKSLKIDADGAWTVTIRSVQTLREFDGNSVTGTGNDVVIYRGETGIATVTHDGQGYFSVWAYGDSTDLIANEVGAFTGDVPLHAGPSFVSVGADGNWSITVN